MRRLVYVFALIALAATSPRARAQEAAPASFADSLIEASNAAGVFEPVGDGGAVRHVGSGIVCHFQDGGGRIVLFEGSARGDDVACEFSEAARNVRLYATRLPRRATLDELLAAVDAAVRRATPELESYPATLSIAANPSLPASRSVQYLTPSADGVRDFLRISIAQAGDWTIKMRYRAPAPDAAAASRLEERAELTWRAALAEMAR